jgi:hypothetical protein
LIHRKKKRLRLKVGGLTALPGTDAQGAANRFTERFSNLDLLCIQIDGLHFDNHVLAASIGARSAMGPF